MPLGTPGSEAAWRCLQTDLHQRHFDFHRRALSEGNLREQSKRQNLGRDYAEAVRRIHSLGVMVNGSFVFGMGHDDATVFPRTVEWAISQGIETATFHILTPYPGTALHQRMRAEGRLLHREWDLYDTRHAVFRPARLTPQELEAGYWKAYEDFYSWSSIWRGATAKRSFGPGLRHLAYAAGWKKFERGWDLLIRLRHVARARPLLESVLGGRPRAAKGRDSSLAVDEAAEAVRMLG